MPHQPLPWQFPAWESIANQIELKRLPHALMLVGPAEIGKKHLALLLAQRMLCATPVAGIACGQCRQCQLFVAGSHPDFLLIEPEAPGKAIRVDEIRALSEFATKTASQGSWRVMLLCPAEALNISAANAFLKTLEEPGPQVLIIMVCHQAGAVLPTIRSRCRILPLAEPSGELARRWLAEQRGELREPAELERALDQASGRPLRALRFLESGLQDQLQRFEAALTGLEGGTVTVLDAAKALQELPGADLIDWFQRRVYRRLRSPELLASTLSWRFFRFLDRLTLTRQRIHGASNPNAQLLWEDVLMDWKAVIDYYHRQTRHS